VKATKADGSIQSFVAKVRINTPMEWQYYRHGGVLQYMLRQMAA
jgi:aconitate hydratase